MEWTEICKPITKKIYYLVQRKRYIILFNKKLVENGISNKQGFKKIKKAVIPNKKEVIEFTNYLKTVQSTHNSECARYFHKRRKF